MQPQADMPSTNAYKQPLTPEELLAKFCPGLAAAAADGWAPEFIPGTDLAKRALESADRLHKRRILLIRQTTSSINLQMSLPLALQAI